MKQKHIIGAVAALFILAAFLPILFVPLLVLTLLALIGLVPYVMKHPVWGQNKEDLDEHRHHSLH